MGCCSNFLKISNGIYATFLGILAAALALLNGYELFDMNDDLFIETKSRENLYMPPIVLLVLAVLLFIFIFLACVAICRESSTCMEIYASFLLVLALIQLGLGGWLIVKYSSPITELNLQNLLAKEISQLYQQRHVDSVPMNNVQNWYECCGFNGPNDYPFGKIPDSCCAESEIYCSSGNAYVEGCERAVTDATIGTQFILGMSSVILGVSELIGAILAFAVSCAIWRKQSLSW